MAVEEEIIFDTASAEANTQRLAGDVEKLDHVLSAIGSLTSIIGSGFEMMEAKSSRGFQKMTHEAENFVQVLNKVQAATSAFSSSFNDMLIKSAPSQSSWSRSNMSEFFRRLEVGRVNAGASSLAGTPTEWTTTGANLDQMWGGKNAVSLGSVFEKIYGPNGVGFRQGPIPIQDQITTGAWQGPHQWEPSAGPWQGPRQWEPSAGPWQGPRQWQPGVGFQQGPVHFSDQVTTGAWQGPIQQTGGSGGGLFGGVGAAVWKFAAMLYTIERLGRGIARLAEIVEIAAEKHEADLATLREAGVAEAQLEDTRSQVRGRASALGISGDDFFKAYQKTLNMKFRIGEDPEGVLRSRNELTAGAFVLAGGHGKAAEQRAELMLSELARASQLGDSGRKAGFQNLRGFPGGPVGFLEKYGHYNEAQARDIAGPTKDLKVWQSHLEIFQRTIEAVAQVHLDEDLPTSVSMLSEAFDELVSRGGFKETSKEIRNMSESLKDGSLEVVLKTLDHAVAGVLFLVRALGEAFTLLSTPLEAIYGLFHQDEKNWGLSPSDYNRVTGQVDPRSNERQFFETFSTSDSDEQKALNAISRHSLTVKGAIHPGTDATILPHPSHGHHSVAHPHRSAASLPNGTQLSISMPVTVHHTSQGDHPDEIGKMFASISVIGMQSALEQLGILTHGGSVGA